MPDCVLIKLFVCVCLICLRDRFVCLFVCLFCLFSLVASVVRLFCLWMWFIMFGCVCSFRVFCDCVCVGLLV